MAVKKTNAVAAPDPGINIGDLGMYQAGGGIPEGDYVWTNLDVQMYQAQDKNGQSRGPARLGVMITLLPLADPKEENAKTQFYSMGSSADKSFAPNPETGKGLVQVPGAAGTSLNNSTNWAVLLKSLYDSGLPQGIFSNDVSVLEGVHVHMSNVPEPEDRKGFRAQAATGEAAADQPQRPGTIAIVTEIKDDGKPWEGSGGVPDAAPAKPAPKAAAKPVAKPAAKAVAAAAEEAEPANEELGSVAENAISAILEKNANGMPRLKLRIATFEAVKKSTGDQAANDVIDTYFKEGAEDSLSALLGGIGFSLAGAQVKPA